jgi:hypothetical protein
VAVENNAADKNLIGVVDSQSMDPDQHWVLFWRRPLGRISL